MREGRGDGGREKKIREKRDREVGGGGREGVGEG